MMYLRLKEYTCQPRLWQKAKLLFIIKGYLKTPYDKKETKRFHEQ
jgi:hypothetical protein